MALINVTALTHRGAVRQENEDAIAVNGWIRNASMDAPRTWAFFVDSPILCVVADGMGGHACGERASRIAAQRASILRNRIASAAEAAAVLGEINAEIYTAAQDDESLRGMGTTIAGFVCRPNALIWFNVGDSRLYRYRDGFLRQLSIDHTPATDQRATRSERSHAVTQSLGGAISFKPIAPHVDEDDLLVPSDWLLCSDGLTDMVDLADMNAAMALSAQEAVSSLFESAMRGGGEDNVSIVLASVRDGVSGDVRK